MATFRNIIKRFRKMARVKLKPGTKIGYKISDIGAGGKEYNVRVGEHVTGKHRNKRKVI